MTDQSHVLEYSGLALLLVAVALGLLSFWLNTASGLGVSARFPGVARVIQFKPLMLVAVAAGMMLLLSPRLAPTPKTTTGQPPSDLRPSETTIPAPPSVAASVAASVPANVPAATPVSAVSVPAEPPLALPSQPVTSKKPVTQPPAPEPKPVATEPPEPKPAPAGKTKEPKPAGKTTIFSTRCTRLLEKVGSGEPLSTAEHNEMVSTCQ